MSATLFANESDMARHNYVSQYDDLSIKYPTLQFSSIDPARILNLGKTSDLTDLLRSFLLKEGAGCGCCCRDTLMDFVLAAELEKLWQILILRTSRSKLGSKVDNYIGLPKLNCLPLTAFDFWAILKVPDSVFSSLFLPMYNGIVFEVAVSQTKFELLVDIHEWLDPDIFEVNVIMWP